jgi:NodT family efflux transporter outer membrane factor (OMF) lipoprotein
MRWWDAVGDVILVRLIDEAFAASPTLKSAAARVRSARAQKDSATSNLIPSGGSTASYLNAQVPASSLGSLGGSQPAAGGTSAAPSSLSVKSYTLGFDASWEPDIWGGVRRGIESAGAAAQSSQAAFADAQVQLAAEVGRAYTLLREAQDRVFLARQTIELRDAMVLLTEQRRAGGTASEVDLQRQVDSAADASAQLPPLQSQVDQELDQLALLLGREPGSVDPLLAVSDAAAVAQPLPPTVVPVGSPADWLRRRPDIREAERMLASRTATIGQNVANYFPQVGIVGLIGTSASQPSGLFSGSPLALIAPVLSWNFLSIPGTRAKVRGAEADRDEALGNYEQSVLAALRDANDSLSRFGRTRVAVVERRRARDAAVIAATMTRERYAAGTASRIDLLDTERQRASDEDQLAQAGSLLMQSYVALQKSLGLGWGAAPPSAIVPEEHWRLSARP